MDLDHDIGKITGNLAILDPGSNTLTVLGNKGIQLPIGTTLERPNTNGALRVNSDTGRVEINSANQWVGIRDFSLSSLPAGGAAGQVLIKNSATDYDASFSTISADQAPYAKQLVGYVKNETGSTILKGMPVYQIGNVGDSWTIAVGAADAADPAKMPAIGVLSQDLAPSATGDLIVLGEIRDVNTSIFSEGDLIYVAPGGGYTNVKPTASNVAVQFLGIVTKIHATNGGGYVTGTGTLDAVRFEGSNVFSGWNGTSWTNISGTSGNVILSGDITGSGPIGSSVTTTLANVGIVGTYTSVTTDSKGRVISGTTTQPWSTITSTPTTLSGYGITDGVNTSLLGAINGVATLDGTGKVPSTQLPSYVDDILEYANLANFPVTGETGKIYVALDTDLIYRWSGSTYIEVSAGGTSGTVSSVALSAPIGFAVTGSPVTTTGTLALSYAAGYSLPTTASQTTWDTAYTDRLKWDGGATGLVPATGRTSLGATTVGSNLFTATNPDAISFLRVNADNTVSLLDAASFRAAIGENNGTVTSVGLTVPGTIYTVTGSPVTTSGNLTLSLNQQAAHTVFSGPTTGNAVPTFRTISLGQGDISDVNVPTAAAGRVLYHNGTQWVDELPKNVISLNELLGVSISGAQLGESLYYNGTQWINYGLPGGPSGGGAAKRIWSNNIAASSGTTTIIPGTTAPLVTEGTELWNVTLTPYSTLATYVIQTSVMAAGRVNNSVLTLALFRGSTFIGATAQTVNSSNNSTTLTVNITDRPNTVSPITYSLRVGISVNTWYVNRRINEVTYNGQMNNGWVMWEY